MKTLNKAALVGALCALAAASPIAQAAVSPEEAEQLKTTLTPLGAERAGNQEGTIPEWTGGLTTPTPRFQNGGKRPDPFPDEKPLFSITAENMDQYAEKLTEGTKVMLKKYPTFRVDVYPTHRTAAAPQWVYDNTFKNATRARLDGYTPSGAFGGIPFPIPKSGAEVMWNHELRWRGVAYHMDYTNWLVTADGKSVLMTDGRIKTQLPYYFQEGSPEEFDGYYQMIAGDSVGPPLRAGEQITGRVHTTASGSMTWVYLTGQRRVRRLPNSGGDTPTPFSGGLATFDEVDVFGSASISLPAFDWEILGKKEMYIPYNSNITLAAPKYSDLLGGHFLNPDHVRWELHRVWVVESTLKPGQRHIAPRSQYYVDEDAWLAVLADRWDAKGQLWRELVNLPIAAPDMPAAIGVMWGFYDLISGSYYLSNLYNEKAEQLKVTERYPGRLFTADAMAARGVR